MLIKSKSTSQIPINHPSDSPEVSDGSPRAFGSSQGKQKGKNSGGYFSAEVHKVGAQNKFKPAG